MFLLGLFYKDSYSQAKPFSVTMSTKMTKMRYWKCTSGKRVKKALNSHQETTKKGEMEQSLQRNTDGTIQCELIFLCILTKLSLKNQKIDMPILLPKFLLY